MQRFATVLLAASTVVLAACGMESPTGPSPAAQAGAPFTRAYVIVGTLNDGDKQFIAFMAQAYQAQITLGQLAENRGDTAAVKAFARQMRQDATAALASLRSMAPTDVPTTITLNGQQQGWATTLSSESGSGLDRTYMGFMLTEFQTNITQFTALASGKNSGLVSHSADYVARLNSLTDDLRDLARRVGAV